MTLRRKKPSPLILECFISTKADPVIEHQLCAQYCSRYQGYLSEKKKKEREKCSVIMNIIKSNFIICPQIYILVLKLVCGEF